METLKTKFQGGHGIRPRCIDEFAKRGVCKAKQTLCMSPKWWFAENVFPPAIADTNLRFYQGKANEIYMQLAYHGDICVD